MSAESGTENDNNVSGLEDTAASTGESGPDAIGFTQTMLSTKGADGKPSVTIQPNSPASASLTGSKVGKYDVREKLGAGAMGEVYAAYDPELDRTVALKLLVNLGSDFARSLFLREAQAMAKLSHPNVVTIYEVGTVGQQDYIAMEYVDGETLDRWCADKPASEVVQAYRQAALGLAAAHKAGLVHRDFKPLNVLVCSDGRVRVTDFGVALHLVANEEDGDSNVLTIVGTPAYMSPEQHVGDSVDGRSDQFSFCVSLFEALLGKRPYGGNTLGELREQVVKGLLVIPADATIDSGVLRLLKKGLSTRPTDRYASMEECIDVLSPKAKPRLWVFASVGVVLLALGALLVALWAGSNAGGPDTCLDNADLTGVWADGKREQIRASYVNAAFVGAVDRFDELAVVLDGYAETWQSSSREICEERGTADAKDNALRTSCVEDRRRSLAALTEVLSDAEEFTLSNALQLADRLPPLDDCNNIGALRLGVAPPADELEAEVGQARKTLAALHVKLAALILGESQAGQELVELATMTAVQATTLGYLPLVAEAENLSGRICMQLSMTSCARKAFRAALLSAEQAGYDQEYAASLVNSAYLLAKTSSDYAAGRQMTQRAQAATSRLSAKGLRVGDLQATVAISRAILATQERHYDDALAVLEEALLLPVMPAVDRGTLMRILWEVHEMRGDYKQAVEVGQRLYVHATGAYGTNHPITGLTHFILSVSMRTAGMIAAAKEIEAVRGNDKRLLLRFKARGSWREPVRTIRGQVRDKEGKSVPGARVRAGLVLADRESFDFAVYPGANESATTNQNGDYSLLVHAGEQRIVSESADGVLRSIVMPLAAGEEDQDQDLIVEPTASLTGRVLDISQKTARVFISGAKGGQARSSLDPDGTFVFHNLVPDSYEVVVTAGATDAIVSHHSTRTTIDVDNPNLVSIQWSGGVSTLLVRVKGRAGAAIPVADVYLVRGQAGLETRVKTLGNLEEEALDMLLGTRVAAGTEGQIENVAAGQHIVCIVPHAADPQDPETEERLAQSKIDVMATPVQCRTLAVEGETSVKFEVEPAPVLTPQ